jgi:hypothetical protein
MFVLQYKIFLYYRGWKWVEWWDSRAGQGFLAPQGTEQASKSHFELISNLWHHLENSKNVLSLFVVNVL